MRHLSRLLVTLALVAAPHPSAHGQRAVKVEEAEEYAVFSFIVNKIYTFTEEPLTISEDGLAQELSTELSHLRALVREGQLSPSLVDDFEARNKAPFTLGRQFEIKVPYLLRPTRECPELRVRESLERYRAKCPDLSGEVIVLSRVGFMGVLLLAAAIAAALVAAGALLGGGAVAGGSAAAGGGKLAGWTLGGLAVGSGMAFAM